MNNIFKYIFIIINLLILNINIINADSNSINLIVSPIKYEIDAYTGTTITKKALLYNKSNKIFSIITGKSDFESKNTSGTPHFVRKSELVYPEQSMSEWININTHSFTINPGETKEISFDIVIPNDATPGGYYSAVFFKNNNSIDSNIVTNNIQINVDYGVIILLTINGKIITKGSVVETSVDTKGGWGGGGGYSNIKIDNCKIDLTKSKYDGKCIDSFFKDKTIKKSIDKLELGKESNKTKKDFDIEFELLFENEGNVHIKPKGKIKLTDDNGNTLKGIGKKTIKNNDGTIIGYDIVNYIPLNDNGGNILPGTERIFKSNWKGFPYKLFDEKGNPIVHYWSPGEYYTKKNTINGRILYPWERINEKIKHKKINANIEFSYIDENGKNIPFNSAKEFYIDYKEEYIGFNPYILLIIILISIIWIIFKRKKYICINNNCKKKIDKKMKICPYCETKQAR